MANLSGYDNVKFIFEMKIAAKIMKYIILCQSIIMVNKDFHRAYHTGRMVYLVCRVFCSPTVYTSTVVSHVTSVCFPSAFF